MTPAPLRRSAMRLVVLAATLALMLALVPEMSFATASHKPAPKHKVSEKGKKKLKHKARKKKAKKKVKVKPAGPPVVGIAEQHGDLFSDPLFVASGVTHTRLLIGWNGIYDAKQRAEMDDYLNQANAQHIDVLVTFGNSRTNGKDRPTPQALVQAFRSFRQRFPWVTEFSTWNEPNLQGAKPQLTAQYYRALRRDCPACTILAADLVDNDKMQGWVKSFLRAAKMQPPLWGLHNYVDANKFIASGTKGLLALTTGAVWLTETGGVVERHNSSPIVFATGLDHAAQSIRFIFNKLVPMSPRVRRVYLYNWRANPGPSTWDSALTNADRTPRSSYIEMRKQLRRFGVPGVSIAGLSIPGL